MQKSKWNAMTGKAVCILFIILCFCGCQQQAADDSATDDVKNASGTEEADIEEPQLSEEEQEYNRLVTKLKKQMDTMTLNEKVSQMFFIRCPEENAAEAMKKYQLGGFLLFGRDFENETKKSMTQRIAEYQSQAKIPAFIGVDEEGGTVVRVSRYKAFRDKPFQSPRTVYQNGGWDAVEKDTVEKADLLTALGINVNFAPVCDIARSSRDFIYDRAFGTTAEEVSTYASRVVNIMNDKGIGAVLKHFPGYGDNVDTHTGIAYDERTIDEFRSTDLLPFTAGIQANAPFVLVSHSIVTSMDRTMPASLSKNVIKVLRDDLDFQNLIITDDLSMDAITKYTNDNAAAVLAVQAGNDMICCSNYAPQIEAVVDAVRRGEITEERIEQSVLRILLVKNDLVKD